MKPKNVLKGRIAESLVNELLRKAGCRVYRFGYEAVIQNLTQLESNVLSDPDSDIARQIRSIPDFLIIQNNKPFFVEVKFKTRIEAHFDEKIEEGADMIRQLDRINQFWKAKVIFVTTEKPYFRISYPPYYLKQNKNELLSSPLESDGDLKVSSDILLEFNKLVEEFYK